MKCRYCRESAGFLRRLCDPCRKMLEVVGDLEPGSGFRRLLDALAGTGAGEEKIKVFLSADVDGKGSLQDRLTARMTNDLAEGLGQPSALTARDVERIRRYGDTDIDGQP